MISKRIVTLVLALLITLSFSTSAFAQVSTFNNDTIPMGASSVEDIEDLDITFVKKLETATLPEQDINELVVETTLEKDFSELNIDLSKHNAQTFTFDTKEFRSANSITQTFTGTLAAQGDISYMNVTLAPNQIVQTSLKCPNNPALDYDLLLYDYKADGSLGELVTQSSTETYFNFYPDGTTKTVDEGMAYINKTSINKTYAIIVIASIGGSATDMFELTISLDVYGSYDAAEPSDSAFFAYGVSGSTVTGANLNVSNDQDWFYWSAPNNMKGLEARISVSGAPYNVEVFKNVSGTNQMVLCKPDSAGFYSLREPRYIRVYSDASEFVDSTYTLELQILGTIPSEMLVLLDGGEGQNDYPSYPQGQNFRFKHEFFPHVAIVDSNELPIRNHSVSLELVSEYWINDKDKYKRASDRTDENGMVTLLVKPAVAIGLHTYTIPVLNIVHEYDIDTYTISSPGLPDYKNFVYHFSNTN